MSETLELARTGTALGVRPITPITGAEIEGVDLSRELDRPSVAAIRQALLKHKVLVFRDQELSDAQQIRFSRYFGRVTPAHPITNGLVDAPEIKQNILTRDRD